MLLQIVLIKNREKKKHLEEEKIKENQHDRHSDWTTNWKSLTWKIVPSQIPWNTNLRMETILFFTLINTDNNILSIFHKI